MSSPKEQPKSKPTRTRLTPRGQKILTACLEQPTWERAAAAAGVSTVTLWRYRQKPEFDKAMHELGKRGLEEGYARLQRVATAGANVTIKIMLDPTVPPAVRLRAAEEILRCADKAMQAEDLEERLSALEQAPAQQQGLHVVPKPVDPPDRNTEPQPPPTLSRREERILVAVLEHTTDERSAVAAGVSTQTVARCRKKPEFQKEYRKARRLIVAQAMVRMQQAFPAAVQTIVRLALEPGISPATQLRAATALVHYGQRGAEIDTCEARLTELERSHQSAFEFENHQLSRVV